jgi:hypothetical protein
LSGGLPKDATVQMRVHVGLYSLNGQTIFPIYAPSGGLAAAVYACLIKVEQVEGRQAQYYASPLQLTMADSPESVMAKISGASQAWQRIQPNDNLPGHDGITFQADRISS